MHPPRYSVGMLAENVKDCYPGLTFDGAGQCPPAELLSNEVRREVRSLKRELQRKEKALAETAALLTRSKKARAIWGGGRGRIISTPDRQLAVSLIG